MINEIESKKLKVYENKKFICQVVLLDIEAGRDIIILNSKDALDQDIDPGDRVGIKIKNKLYVAIVDLSDSLIKEGQIGIFKDIGKKFNVNNNDFVEIVHIPTPLSLEAIRKKINGGHLNKEEMFSLIDDLMKNKLSEPELAAFMTAVNIIGLNKEETINITNAIVESGNTLDLDVSPIVDKHCIGGVPGNRTTMLIVPILSAAGLYIPKTSSRAITSPAGTADTMEVLANVDFSMEELREIVLKLKGAIVWGGGMNIAPADDLMIKIRRPLHLDPKGLLLSSILAKKKAVNSKYVLIDIPVGIGAKIEDIEIAKNLANDFKILGNNLDMEISVILTDGSEPIGNGIGPKLEAQDVLSILEGSKTPSDLREKALNMAGKLLEMVGKVNKGDGYDVALHFLESGKALKQMKKIIEMQGGDPNIKSSDISLDYKYTVKSERDGKIEHIHNRFISNIAHAAGAPQDKGAGIYLHVSKGDKVKKGDILFDIYAESETKLSFAIDMLNEFYPIKFEKMFIEEV